MICNDLFGYLDAVCVCILYNLSLVFLGRGNFASNKSDSLYVCVCVCVCVCVLCILQSINSLVSHD